MFIVALRHNEMQQSTGNIPYTKLPSYQERDRKSGQGERGQREGEIEMRVSPLSE